MGLVPTIQPKTDFSWTHSFHEVLNNVELITYMKLKNILMTRCKDMGKKTPKMPPKWSFPPFVIPNDFFSKSGSVTFVSL